MRRNRALRLGAVFTGTALVASACVGGDSGSSGGSVEIVGAFSGLQQEGFEKDIAAISADLGIDIEYISTNQFEVVLPSRVAAGNAPDIAIFPQPGLLKDLVNDGDLVSLEDAGIDVAAATDAAISGIVDTGTVDGVVYGLPYSVNAKSLVWYPSPEFEDAGYQDATTHSELVDLTNQIKADGTAPWCFGIDAGWPGTDWLEEYVLREGGPEVYDQWVAHEIPFNDPIVKRAGEDVAELLLGDGNIFGGVQAIGQTFDQGAQGLFDDPPSCFLHRQGNFITSFFPEDIQSDLSANVSLFLLPPVEGGFDGQPILGGGDFMAMFDADNADAAAVLEAIASSDFGSESAQTGAWLSPYTAFDGSNYPNETLANISTLLGNADTFRFDGSDSMPGEIGNQVFWQAMVQWMTGSISLDQALNDVEDA